MKRAVEWRVLFDKSYGLWWREVSSQSNSLGKELGDKHSGLSFLLTSDLLFPRLDPCRSQRAREPVGSPYRSSFCDTKTSGVGWKDHLEIQNIEHTFHLVLPSSNLYLVARMIFLKHESDLVLPHLDVLW